MTKKTLEPFLELCVSSLRRGHANLLCIVPILSDVRRQDSLNCRGIYGLITKHFQHLRAASYSRTIMLGTANGAAHDTTCGSDLRPGLSVASSCPRATHRRLYHRQDQCAGAKPSDKDQHSWAGAQNPCALSAGTPELYVLPLLKLMPSHASCRVGEGATARLTLGVFLLHWHRCTAPGPGHLAVLCCQHPEQPQGLFGVQLQSACASSKRACKRCR